MTISPVFNHVKKTLIIKAETTMGTAIALTAPDNNIEWIQDSIEVDPQIEMAVNEFASGRHSIGPGTMGLKKMTVKAKALLRVGAAVGTAPTLGKAFIACGQLETIVAITSVAYTPAATHDQGDNINITAEVIFVPTSGNCIIVKMKGAMGNCQIGYDGGGKPWIAEFEFTGCFVSITDGAALALTSPDALVAPGSVGTVITENSVAQKVSKFKLDFGNTIELDEDPTDQSGYGAAYISKRVPKISWDPKATLLATDPQYTNWAAGTELAVSLTTAAVNSIKYTVTAPKVQIAVQKFGKRGTTLTWDQTGDCHENTGDDAHQIIQSA